MSTTNTTCTPSSNSNLIVTNSTGSRICGINSLNSTILQSCCDGNAVKEYHCIQYCSAPLFTIGRFVDCVAEASSPDDILGLNPFCQEGITSNITETLRSSGAIGRKSAPALKVLSWLLILNLIAGAQGKIVPSLATNVHRRQSSSGCTINITKNYTTVRNSRKISPDFYCQDTFCTQNIPVDTGLLNNNRTINDTSAADPQYDMFFELLQNQTGRSFPALSSVELNYDFVVSPGGFFVDFTPYAWCINATVSNCADVIGETDAETPINACGPLFVSDYVTDSPDTPDMETIQGVLNPVKFN